MNDTGIWWDCESMNAGYLDKLREHVRSLPEMRDEHEAGLAVCMTDRELGYLEGLRETLRILNGETPLLGGRLAREARLLRDHESHWTLDDSGGRYCAICLRRWNF